MADALEPLLKKIRIAFGKKLGMPSYQEVNAQDFPAQIDRIPTIADGSIPKYAGPFMVTPTDHAQTIQTEGKYSEANITVAPAPPSGVEIKEWQPQKTGDTLTSDKYIVPLGVVCNTIDSAHADSTSIALQYLIKYPTGFFISGIILELFAGSGSGSYTTPIYNGNNLQVSRLGFSVQKRGASLEIIKYENPSPIILQKSISAQINLPATISYNKFKVLYYEI